MMHKVVDLHAASFAATHWMPLSEPQKDEPSFQCSIDYPGCAKNCGDYGCGN